MSRKSSEDTQKMEQENTIEEVKPESISVSTKKSAKTTDKKVVNPLCRLISKANYTISILENNQRKFIPPYGQILVNKNSVIVEYENDAKFLIFAK